METSIERVTPRSSPAIAWSGSTPSATDAPGEQISIERVGVVGLGTMGAGIAQVCLQAGVETVGREVTTSWPNAARATITTT